MTELPEQKNKLPLVKRRELLEKIADSKAGQALREELVDIMNDICNVNKLADGDFMDQDILTAEVRGMVRARSYIQGIYLRLFPKDEVKEEAPKVHK